MNAGIPHLVPRIRTYWIVWLSAIAAAFTLRFTVFRGVASEQRFNLAITYMLGTWVPVMILNFIEGRRLMEYLKTHHHQKWQELTYVPGFGPGGRNGFRVMRWLYSADDLSDPAVTVLKAELRAFIRFVFTVFFSYLLILPLLSL